MNHSEDYAFDLALIHHQDLTLVMDSKIKNQLKEIMYSGSTMKCVDAYFLGYMQGKRAERAKKKARVIA